MPRRTKKQKQKEMRIALALGGLVLAAVLCALTLTAPGFTDWMFELTGVTQRQIVPLAESDSPVGLHVIDVGQGDAALIEDNGEFALWDAGPPEAARDLVAYLEAAGVKKLRYVFLTHPHSDHYGGMEAVVEAFEIEQLVLPNLNLAPYPTARGFLALLEAANAKAIPTELAAAGTEYALGQGHITVLHSGLADDDNYNLLSPALYYAGDGLTVLDTGDAEKANEKALLEDGTLLDADVLLAGHHGSATSNTEAFVGRVSPGLVVVSCAAGNSYGHPHKSALSAFEAVNARMLRTDKDGSVVVRPAETGLAVGTEKEQKEAA